MNLIQSAKDHDLARELKKVVKNALAYHQANATFQGIDEVIPLKEKDDDTYYYYFIRHLPFSGKFLVMFIESVHNFDPYTDDFIEIDSAEFTPKELELLKDKLEPKRYGFKSDVLFSFDNGTKKKKSTRKLKRKTPKRKSARKSKRRMRK